MGPGYPQPPEQMGPPAPPPQQQPPVPQMGAPSPTMQAPGPGSLGGVVDQANAPDSPMAQFQQAMQMTMQAYAPALRPEIPPPQAPGVLANILTMGMAGLFHKDYVNAYNRKVQQQNTLVKMAAAKDAFDLIQSQQQIAALGGRQNLALLNFQLQLERLQDTRREAEARALERERRRVLGETEPNRPLTPQQRGAAVDQGLVPQIDPTTGRRRWVETPKAYMPPAADAPLGSLAGPDTASGEVPDRALTGELGTAALEKAQADQKAAAAVQTAQDKLSVPTTATRTMAEVAPKVIALADEAEKQLDTIQAGPWKSRVQEFMAGTIGTPNAPFTKYRANLMLLQTMLMRMHVGARGSQQIMEHFKNIIDQGKQSPENMKAALGEIRLYAQDVMKAGQVQKPTTSSGAPSKRVGLREFLAE